MYGLIVKLMVAPGKRDQFMDILRQSAVGMPGCLSYVVAKDSSDENTVWVTRDEADGALLASRTAREPRSSSPVSGRQEGRWISFWPAQGISFRAAPAGGNSWHSWFF